MLRVVFLAPSNKLPLTTTTFWLTFQVAETADTDLLLSTVRLAIT